MKRIIIVIGAGLAGLYAAWSAASHGANVKLYEQGSIGSKHNCGEMFTEIYTSAPEECKLNKIDVFKIILNGKVTYYNLGDTSPFVMTDKCKHELIMKEKCLQLGVEIIERTRAPECNTTDYIKVINASGANYTYSLGKAVAYITKNDKANHKYLLTRNNVAVFEIRDDLMGYKWMFPRGLDQCNIGEGVYDHKFNVSLFKPEDKDIVYRGGGMLPMPTMDEFYSRIRKCSNDNSVLYVGNALGLVNPATGGGEHLAVISGILAGELMAKDNECMYYTALMDIIGDEMRIGISVYEFMKKLDSNSLAGFIESKFIDKDNCMILNSKLRSTIKKWVHIPDVNNNDMLQFVKE